MHLSWGFVCWMCTALSGENLFHWQLTFGVCGHPSHNSVQKPHIGLEYRVITAVISLYSDSLNYGYEEQPSSLLMTDLLKASFQQACTRNPFKVLSIKPLNWSLKLLLQTVTRELLVSPFSVVSPVLHYPSSVPRRACTSASVLCSEFPVCMRSRKHEGCSVVWVEMYLFVPNYTG